MAFSAQAVANEFIGIAGPGRLDPMKLQKLVYFAHGWHLAIENEPLTRQSFEAWQFGPVIPDLYRAFRKYGSANVTNFATKRSTVTLREVTPRIRAEGDAASRAALEVIQQVWSIYGPYSAIKLSNATHMPGTPWAKWYTPAKHHIVIPDEDIRDYFKNLEAKGGESFAVTANS